MPGPTFIALDLGNALADTLCIEIVCMSVGIFPNGFEGMATDPSHPPSSGHEEPSAAGPTLPCWPNSVTFQLSPQQQAGVFLKPAANILLPITQKWRPSSLLPGNSVSAAGRVLHGPSSGMASPGQSPSAAQCPVCSPLLVLETGLLSPQGRAKRGPRCLHSSICWVCRGTEAGPGLPQHLSLSCRRTMAWWFHRSESSPPLLLPTLLPRVSPH